MSRDSDKKRTECTPRKLFRCRSVDRLIYKCPKPPKDKKKRHNQVRFNERGNCSSLKGSENGDNNNDQNIYASMSQMSGNDESYSRYFAES